MKIALRILAVLALLGVAEARALTNDQLMGKWALSGKTCSYTYEFFFTSAVEKRVIMGADMTVWTGAGNFSVRENTLMITLDRTASDTPVVEIFLVESYDGSKLVLRGRARYFNDIDSERVEFTRIPD